MFEEHINLGAHLMLNTDEPNTLSHITRNSTSQHMGIKIAENDSKGEITRPKIIAGYHPK
jgi:hypothetical protein